MLRCLAQLPLFASDRLDWLLHMQCDILTAANRRAKEDVAGNSRSFQTSDICTAKVTPLDHAPRQW